MKLIVLMSTYNGEKYLKEQLDSLLNQKLLPAKILIRDDGSKDKTIDIVKEYQKNYKNIEYYIGNNLGPGKSFFDLMNKVEDADYYALCDQDDVWFKDKLSSAVDLLEKENKEIPLLYAGRFILADQDLNPLDSKISKLYSFNDFAHSLIYHSAPGCTFVFNKKCLDLVKQYGVNKNYFVIHDAIIHKVATMFGKMILDDTPQMYYRQHSNNAIGLTANRFKEIKQRIKNFLGNKLRNYRSNTAKSLLNVYGDKCNEENKELLNIVANYQESFKLRMKLLFDKRFRSNTYNDAFYFVLVLLNRI